MEMTTHVGVAHKVVQLNLTTINKNRYGSLGESQEYLTQKGAKALAMRLEEYWHQRGYPAARFWIEPLPERFEKIGTCEIYRILSNLVNGLPPRYADRGMEN